MKKIVIAGSHSSIGKTLLAEELLRKLKGWSALKVTVSRKTGCPRGKVNSCNVCSEMERDFEIVKEKKKINEKNTDTARLKKAGAKKVVWLKATLKGLKTGLRKSLQALKNSEGIVIEGTSVLKFIKPDLSIYLKDSIGSLRPSAKDAETKADIIVDVSR